VPDARPRAVIGAEDLGRSLRRMAHELLERADGPERLVLLGIRSRGVPLAQRLGRAMQRIEGLDVPVGALDVSLYRDDYARRGPRALGRTEVPVDLTGRVVVLVDDVLYTGRTIRAAMTAVADHGRPAAIRLAVLVDRGHRELPIRADVVGKNLPTAPGDDVEVRLTETDGIDEVVVTHAGPETDPETKDDPGPDAA
jgi:pyrimidine operon attenuation protein/uracil phosphoribosyltransferase